MFYLAIGWEIVACIEKIFVLLRLDDIKPGVKGLYWLMKRNSCSIIYFPIVYRMLSVNSM
jgi:hypothetical protein